jgi:hypothetical protein
MKSEIINALQCKFPPQDPTTREMAKIGYYSKYKKACWGGVVPAGVEGKFLWELGRTIEAGISQTLQHRPVCGSF